MKAVYLDTFSGISGNMLLGALLDAGFPAAALREELRKLPLGEYALVLEKVSKCGIEAQYFNVLLPQHEHEIHGDADFWQHYQQDDADHAAHAHEHAGHAHGHVHADLGDENFWQEHEHELCGAAEGHVHTGHQHQHHEHRNLHDIMGIIGASSLSAQIKEQSGKVFTAIAAVEAKVHGKSIDEVHFHEIGAIDTIIDVVGCLLGLEYLGIEKIYVSRVTTGCGFIDCAHGRMPVPAPATAELLLGLPQRQGDIAKELTTPTGAALLRVLAQPVPELPKSFQTAKIAYGAGTWDLASPNVLRLYLGEDNAQETEELVEAACNIDDMGGEFFAHALEQLLANGALDAWLEPIIMKKGRPAYKLSLLAARTQLDSLLALVFKETTTLGVRYHTVERTVLERGTMAVRLPQGTASVKYGKLAGGVVNLAPEYESCKALAEATGCPLKEIFAAAVRAAREALNE